MSDEALARAEAEMRFCENVLAKSGATVLTATLQGAAPTQWEHYPPGDVYDPETGAQWYYHSHAPGEVGAGTEAGSREHGHFHCFVRPDGREGSVHHLVAVGVDAQGRLTRLFTVNRWVTADDPLPAEKATALIERFDIHLDTPSYLVNRWLAAVYRLHAASIEALLYQRDATFSAHSPQDGGDPGEDRTLEILSERAFPPHA